MLQWLTAAHPGTLVVCTRTFSTPCPQCAALTLALRRLIYQVGFPHMHCTTRLPIQTLGDGVSWMGRRLLCTPPALHIPRAFFFPLRIMRLLNHRKPCHASFLHFSSSWAQRVVTAQFVPQFSCISPFFPPSAAKLALKFSFWSVWCAHLPECRKF